MFKAIAVGLIQTRLPGIKEGILDKAVETLHGRLTALEGTLAREVRCSHDEDEVAAAIRTLWQSGVGLILILGASATIDRRDVVPGESRAPAGRSTISECQWIPATSPCSRTVVRSP